MTTENQATAALIRLTDLRESPLNPRKHFNQTALAELTESVKAHGVLTPLLVRPVTGKVSSHEILAGARRFRAATAAGLELVPCVVRHLGDEQALEVMLIENLQRADVHPLEEAAGFQQMMTIGRYNPTQLAAKVGKDESYVRRRVQLLKLSADWKKAFEQGEIQLAHAHELCRLTDGEQKRARKAHTGGYRRWLSPHELREWIGDNVHMQLKKAPFPKNDATLVPAAGSCVDCAKRTGKSPLLFPDIKSPDICTDPACFASKLDAFVKAETIRLRESGKPFVLMTSVEESHRTEYSTPPKGSGAISARSINGRDEGKVCKNQELALIITGPDRGTTHRICRKKGCAVHTYRSLGERSSRTAADRKRDAARKAKAELEEKTLERAMGALYERIQKPGRRELILIGGELWQGITLPDALTKLFGLQRATYVSIGGLLSKLTDEQLGKFVACCAYHGDGGNWPYEKKLLAEAFAEHKIDLAQIKREIEKGPQKPAKPQRGTCRICGCTEGTPCDVGIEGACAWADRTQTLCTNPGCLRAAKGGTNGKAEKGQAGKAPKAEAKARAAGARA